MQIPSSTRYYATFTESWKDSPKRDRAPCRVQLSVERQPQKGPVATRNPVSRGTTAPKGAGHRGIQFPVGASLGWTVSFDA